MDKFFNTLAGLGMTIAAGLFLIASLIMLLTGYAPPFDPAWATIAISGPPLAYIALKSLLLEKRITSALLITMAMIAAIAIGEFFAAGEIAFIMAIGAILEEKTVARARRGIKKLINLVPQQGRRINQAGDEQTVAVASIRQGDIIRVLPGETIAVDGDIVSGNTSVDQSVMTGESIPADKGPGQRVFSGTINLYGSIDFKASKVGEDSSVQKLVRMVREAENSQAPTQRLVDKWASWLVPIALLIALATYFIMNDIVRAVTVLVVFCPCALVLATPTSIMAAIGQASKYGVIIKSGEALENMGRVNCLAFDKTGTITQAKLKVSDVLVLADGMSEDDLLRIAASAEARSEHPLARAVGALAGTRGLRPAPAAAFTMAPGKGVSAIVAGNMIVCGNPAYLAENNIALSQPQQALLDKLRGQGKAVILVGKDGQLAGMLALSDSLHPEADKMVAELKELATDVVLLTGDNQQAAAYFARQAGINKVQAGLLPQDKVASIKKLQQQGVIMGMVGDGVNDAPALKTANVGVAMGTMGSDLAIEAADIALMGDDIGKIPYLKKLSNVTLRTIKVNIILALAINLVAIGLSVAGILNPVTGALVHNAGAVLVVLNAALLYDRNIINSPPAIKPGPLAPAHSA